MKKELKKSLNDAIREMSALELAALSNVIEDQLKKSVVLKIIIEVRDGRDGREWRIMQTRDFSKPISEDLSKSEASIRKICGAAISECKKLSVRQRSSGNAPAAL